jgi:hypothetical protein
MDREVHARLVAIIEAAKAQHQVPEGVDSEALVTTISALGDGLFMRRALDPAFDPEEGFRLLLAVMHGIIAGKMDLGGASAAPLPADRPDQPGQPSRLAL